MFPFSAFHGCLLPDFSGFTSPGIFSSELLASVSDSVPQLVLFFPIQHTFGKCAVFSKIYKSSFHPLWEWSIYWHSHSHCGILLVLHFAVNECPLHLLLVKQQRFRELNPFLYYIWPARFINCKPPASHGNNKEWTTKVGPLLVSALIFEINVLFPLREKINGAQHYLADQNAHFHIASLLLYGPPSRLSSVFF